MNYENCFQTLIKLDFVIIILKTSKEYLSNFFLKSLKEISSSSRKTSNNISTFFFKREIKLFNEVIIYENNLKIQALNTLIINFSKI